MAPGGALVHGLQTPPLVAPGWVLHRVHPARYCPPAEQMERWGHARHCRPVKKVPLAHEQLETETLPTGDHGKLGGQAMGYCSEVGQ